MADTSPKTLIRADTSRYVRPEISRYKRIVDDDGPCDLKLPPTDSITMIRKPSKRICEDWRLNKDACKTLATMPQDGESLHAVLGGTHTLWQLVPALLERSGANHFEELYLATLSYSGEVADELLAMIDAEKIKRFGLYFSSWSADTESGAKLYDSLVPRLLERGHSVLAMNIHCKLILAKLDNGQHYVCEASVNLRSCRSLEQMVLTRDATLFDFHRSWMQDMHAKALKYGRHGEKHAYGKPTKTARKDQ